MKQRMNRKLILKIAFAFFLFLSGIFFCYSHIFHWMALQKYEESRPFFGTTIILNACYERGSFPRVIETFKKVWDKFEEFQWRFNIFDDRSDIAKINSSHGKPILIGADTYQLLKDSTSYAQLTNGAFDITVYPLIELWKNAEKKDKIPTAGELKTVLTRIGGKNIAILSDSRVRLLNKMARVDVGGIAAGYGADQAVKILKENGLKNFLIDTGGELFGAGKNCEGKPWRIGISDPMDSARFIDIIRLHERGVSTSGNYEKYFRIENQRWSHIINPVTGYPQAAVASATVIAPTATAADALSTALCILGGVEGIKFIDKLGEGFAAMIIEGEAKDKIHIYKSANYDKLKL